jgi:putative DNA primase/helicase
MLERLLNRRANETERLDRGGIRITITVGYKPDGTPGEIFIDRCKTGNDIESIARDAGVLLSLALQHGTPIETIRHAVTRGGSGSGRTDSGGNCRSPANDFKIPRSKMSIGPRRQRLDNVGRDALREVAADIVTDFRGPHNRRLSSRKELRWGNKGSFALVIVGPKKGLWFDHEIGRGGDVIEFIKHALHCTFSEALNYVGRFVSGSVTNQRSPAPPLFDNTDDERRMQQALTIWCDGWPLRGRLAEIYLQSRGIEVPADALDVLRCHPRCPWRIGTRPALIGLVRDILTNEPLGIHRTALTADGRKLDRPKLLGPTLGGAIKLSGEYVAGELTIAEGIETALSATMLGFGPTWSVIDAGGIAKFPVLPEIERLTIIVDHDVSGVGQKAAAECRARWTAAGRYVRRVMAVTPGDDLNDVLRECQSKQNGNGNLKAHGNAGAD